MKSQTPQHDRAAAIIAELNDPKTPLWKQRVLRTELNSVFLKVDTQAAGEPEITGE